MTLVGGSAATAALPPAVAVAATTESSAAPSGAPADTMTASVPAERRGMRAWSGKMRWSFVISIVLLAGVVAGSVLIAQSVAANSRAAQELAAAVTELEAAEAAATEPEFVLTEAVVIYDDTVVNAQATADSAGPPLAAVTGMVAEAALAASDAALADLVAYLAVDTAFEPPAAYERGDVDVGDIAAVEAATEAADAHAVAVNAVADEVRLAQVALQAKLDALRAAQVALGASLPEAAEAIVGGEPRRGSELPRRGRRRCCGGRRCADRGRLG